MLNRSPAELSTVVANIYEAAYDQDRWTDAMSSLCDLFNGSRACVVRAEMNTYKSGTIGGHSSAAIGSYSDDTFQAADWNILGASEMAAGMRTMPVGECYRRSEIVDEAVFRTTELWLDYFCPRDMDDNLSCNLRLTEDSFWAVDVARSARHGGFELDDVDVLRRLAPHLLRAGQIGNSLESTSTLSSLYADLPFGMLIIDRERCVYHLNRAAETILSSPGTPLLTRGGRLVMPSRKEAVHLERMIASACDENSDGIVGPGGTAIFPRLENGVRQQRLLVSVAPLSRTLSYGLPTRRNAAIMIREIGRDTETGIAKTLPVLFGLSPSEARIASGLAEGKSLKEIAAENGITVKTVRSYLETVFRKTGTHRQSELVSIIKTTQPLLT